MNKNSADSTPFLVLNAIMDNNYRETVIRRALGYRKAATQHAHIGNSVKLGIINNLIKSAVTRLRLCVHSNIAT